MIEDDIYRSSTQFRLWSFTRDSLQSLRANTNALAVERIRATQRRVREAVRSTTPSTVEASTPNPSDAEGGGKPDVIARKDVVCLTPEEELEFVGYYCEQTLELGETYNPSLPTAVRATAIQYLRRFYITNSVMTYHPKSIMPCALFLATKSDHYYMPLQEFAKGVPGITNSDEVIAPEFNLTKGLRFTFDVRHPFRGLEGGVMELQAIAQGSGKPGPHHPEKTPEGLRQALLAVTPLDSSPDKQRSIATRIVKAHSKAREILKTAAQMTDAYFLYTPSQIWFSAFLLADRPLAEFYLDIKIGPPAADDGVNVESTNPLTLIRAKIVGTLSNCSQLLKSYRPVSSDPDKRKRLKGIAKKVYQCQQVEKLDPVELGRAQKRGSGTPASATGPVGGADAISENDMERVAKKRRLERERKEKETRDIFGGELVAQRNKGAAM
jgi:cyclin H